MRGIESTVMTHPTGHRTGQHPPTPSTTAPPHNSPHSHPRGPETGHPEAHPHAHPQGTQHGHPHAAQQGSALLATLKTSWKTRAARVIAGATIVRYAAWAGWSIGIGMLIDGHLAAVLIATGVLGYALAQALSAYHQQRQPRAAEKGVRAGLLRALWSQPEYRAPEAGAGADVALMTHDVEKYTNNTYGFQGLILGAVAGPVLVLILLGIAVDWASALVTAAALVLAPVVIGWFQKKFRADAGRSRRMRATLAAQFTAMVRGLETIERHGATERIHAQLENAGERNRLATMKLLSRNQLVLFVSEAAFALCTIAVTVIMATWRLTTGAITNGQAAALLLASIALTSPLQLVGSFFYIGMTGRAAGAAMGRFRARVTPGRGAGTGAAVGVEPGGTTDHRTEGTTRHESTQKAEGHAPAPVTDPTAAHARVTWTTEPIVGLDRASIARGDKVLARDMSFQARPGHPVVVRGKSGVGKSTVLAVLGGALDPVAGTVLRPHQGSALISQRTWLFTGTLRENLLLAAPDASDKQITAALDAVHMEDVVAQRGLDAPIGEDAAFVSAGQAQRISIARGLLSGRGVILCDEPTANLDPETHAEIMALLGQLAATHAVVMVTHHPTASLPNAQVITMAAENDGHRGGGLR